MWKPVYIDSAASLSLPFSGYYSNSVYVAGCGDFAAQGIECPTVPTSIPRGKENGLDIVLMSEDQLKNAIYQSKQAAQAQANTKQQQQQTQSKTMMNPTIYQAENLAGQQEQVRLEVNSSTTTTKTLQLTLTNTGGAAITVPIGSNEFILRGGYTAVPAGLVVDGTFKGNTLAILQNRATANQAERFHGLQLSADNANYYSTGGAIELIDFDAFTDSPKSKVLYNFNRNLSPSALNGLYRLDDTFRGWIDKQSGLTVTIPAGRSIQLNMDFASIAQGSNMVRV